MGFLATNKMNKKESRCSFLHFCFNGRKEPHGPFTCCECGAEYDKIPN